MELPKRKSPRLKNYDYSTPNYYFITICTQNKECIFGKPGDLNIYGKIAEENLQKIPVFNPGVKVDKFVAMPNHIHVIFVLNSNESLNLAVILGQYKSSVTRKIRELEPRKKVWQRSFHDHVIRNQAGYEKIWTYIENNPLKWEEDCFYSGNSGM